MNPVIAALLLDLALEYMPKLIQLWKDSNSSVPFDQWIETFRRAEKPAIDYYREAQTKMGVVPPGERVATPLELLTAAETGVSPDWLDERERSIVQKMVESMQSLQE